MTILGQMSPNNALLDQLAVDMMEDDDNETVIDLDYAEDDNGLSDVNHIEKVFIDGSNDDSTEEPSDESDLEIVTNHCDDDLLLGSQLLEHKKKNKQKEKAEEDPVHKECRQEVDREKQIRVQLEMELELERQQRIRFQKQLEEHMGFALRKEFEDSKLIKSLKLELLKCKHQLQRLKKCSGNGIDQNSNDLNSNDSDKLSNDQFLTCFDCKSEMKSEVSLILHLINHCIDEPEFRLDTAIFRLDEFTDSMVDSIRKSVEYCCPRCNESFDCLEIYYHLYKKHTKERPLKCTTCDVYCTHLDYWSQHIQELHSGRLQSLLYVDIAKTRHRSERLTNGTTGSQSYQPKANYRPIRKNYGLRTTRSRAVVSSDSSEESGDSSDEPEVIQISDSPTPPVAPPVYRPSNSKQTLAAKVSEFKCDFPDCDFKTTSKDKLDFHTSAHTNSKFKCPYCPYVGNILNDIIRHIQKSKKHDGLRVYECRDCSYGTNCLTSFRDHLTKKHFENESEDEADITRYITDMFRNEHSTTR